jgi:hypothetical protein
MPSGRDSFRRNRVAPFVLFYFTITVRQLQDSPASYARFRTWVREWYSANNFRVHLKESCDEICFRRNA